MKRVSFSQSESSTLTQSASGVGGCWRFEMERMRLPRPLSQLGSSELKRESSGDRTRPTTMKGYQRDSEE